MYNEIRQSMGDSRGNTEELKKHIQILAGSGTESRWTLLFFAVGWQQGEPMPLEVIRFIDELYEKGLVRA